MAGFTDWWVKGRLNAPKLFSYVCGEEPVLVEYVLQHLTKQIGAGANNLILVRAGVDSEASIWDAHAQLPVDPTTPKLVIVRDAQLLQQWHRLEEFLRARRQASQNHLLLISAEKRLPTVEDEEGKKISAPQIQALRGAQQAVLQCVPFTQSTAKVAVDWVQAMAPMRPNVAGHLLNRAAGDLRVTRDTCLKLDALGVEISISLVNQLLQQGPADNFVDALLKLEKREALRWIETTPPTEYPRIVAQLDSQLVFLSQLNRMQANQMGYGEIMREVRSKAFLVKEFLPAAKHYDDKHVARRRAVLAQADGVTRRSVRGVLEALVLSW